jgi:hypothetical protein
MASFRKYKGAHLKPRGGARRRGARQQGGHTHFVPSVNRHYHDLYTPENRTHTGKIIGVNIGDIQTQSAGAGFTSTHFNPGHGAGDVPESFYPAYQWSSNYGALIDGSHGGHTRPGLVKPRGGMRRRGAKAHTPGHNGNGSCPAGMHMMPNGTCMEGAYHGAVAGQSGGYKRKPARRSRPVGRRAPRRRR